MSRTRKAKNRRGGNGLDSPNNDSTPSLNHCNAATAAYDEMRKNQGNDAANDLLISKQEQTWKSCSPVWQNKKDNKIECDKNRDDLAKYNDTFCEAYNQYLGDLNPAITQVEATKVEPVAAPINEDEKIKNFANIITAMKDEFNKSLPCGPQVKTWMSKNSSNPDVIALMPIMNNTTPEGLSLQKRIASKGCKMALRTQSGGRKSRKGRKSKKSRKAGKSRKSRKAKKSRKSRKM